MTNRWLPVNASMKSGDLGPRRDGAQRQRGELESGDPALGALLEGVDVGGVEVQPHRLVEELLRLVPGEAEVGAAHLGELPATAQPRQRAAAGRRGWRSTRCSWSGRCSRRKDMASCTSGASMTW